jgi:tRNA threonylcarbamoyladenosine modification (KEOPS) complex Cgi121 subunit
MDVLGTHVGVYCFSGVSQAESIIAFLKESQPPVCLVDAKSIVSPRQIQVAVLNALTFQKYGKMEAKNIYLEILRCLSPDARIGGAFKFIALGKETKDAIAITLEDLMPKVPGLENLIDMDSFFADPRTDFVLVKKIFSVTDEMLKRYSYEQIVITTLAVAASELVRTRSV